MDDGEDEDLGEEDDNIPQDRDGSNGSHSVPSEIGVRAPSDVDMMSVGTKTFVEHYPVPTVGTPIRLADPNELQKQHRDHTDVGPFTDEELFKLVDIMLTSGMSGKKRDWFLKLNRVTGSKGSEHTDFWFRDGLDGILHLLAEPQFVNDMEYKPTKVYADPERQTRIYSETTSADRMWSLQ
ncbi:hypothetical protein FRC06_009427, partial [Ceratobasidium sp. 370]